jgi:hypothetical protein
MNMTGRGKFLLFAISFGLIIAGCGRGNSAANEQEATVNMESVVRDLSILAEARVLLGHQSVGRNVLEGLEQLAAEAGVSLRILEVNGAPPDSGPGVFHSNIGTNEDPDSKCEMFAQLLSGFGKPEYDLAMMKFCYVDLGQETALEVAGMLDRYDRLVTTIRRQRPDVQLVHVTMPLRADPPGKKTFVKRLLGMATSEDADNVLRNAFNDGLRNRYANEELFDLAAMESTLPDGSRSFFEADGKPVYTLARAYTGDGGHLNETARRRAAIAFVSTLASVLEDAASSQEIAASR